MTESKKCGPKNILASGKSLESDLTRSLSRRSGGRKNRVQSDGLEVKVRNLTGIRTKLWLCDAKSTAPRKSDTSAEKYKANLETAPYSPANHHVSSPSPPNAQTITAHGVLSFSLCSRLHRSHLSVPCLREGRRSKQQESRVWHRYWYW